MYEWENHKSYISVISYIGRGLQHQQWIIILTQFPNWQFWRRSTLINDIFINIESEFKLFSWIVMYMHASERYLKVLLNYNTDVFWEDAKSTKKPTQEYIAKYC